MNKQILFYIAGGIIIGSLIGFYMSYNLESYIENDTQNQFKGMCLFDIDDTLTTGTENEKVVQLCIDSGYAVGISTANPFYTPQTVRFFKWMPSNLYNFMLEHNFDTFNNVSTWYLNGKVNRKSYNHIDSYIPEGVNIYGWRKGFSLISSSNLYGIKNSNNMILFDDNRDYIEGIKRFAPNVKVICSGRDCGGELNIKTVSNAIN